MKFLNILTAGILLLFVNMQALSLPSVVSQQALQVGQKVSAIVGNQNISRNWSGYAATDGTFTGVRATWRIPQSSTNDGYGVDATWIGIGGVNDSDLIQIGTQTAINENRSVSHEAFFETLPEPSRPIAIHVNGGDSITASITKKSINEWDISITDNTTKQKLQFSVPYTSSLSSAEWIEEAPSGIRNILPLDNFGTIQFSNASAVEDGKSVTLAQANAQAVHMGNSVGEVLATASTLGNDGASFHVDRTKVSDTEPAVIYRSHFRGFGRVPFAPR